MLDGIMRVKSAILLLFFTKYLYALFLIWSCPYSDYGPKNTVANKIENWVRKSPDQPSRFGPAIVRSCGLDEKWQTGAITG